MIIYDLNDAKIAESMYFFFFFSAIYVGAGTCYERYKSSFKFFLDTLKDNMKYKDITIEPVIVH